MTPMLMNLESRNLPLHLACCTNRETTENTRFFTFLLLSVGAYPFYRMLIVLFCVSFLRSLAGFVFANQGDQTACDGMPPAEM